MCLRSSPLGPLFRQREASKGCNLWLLETPPTSPTAAYPKGPNRVRGTTEGCSGLYFLPPSGLSVSGDLARCPILQGKGLAKRVGGSGVSQSAVRGTNHRLRDPMLHFALQGGLSFFLTRVIFLIPEQSSIAPFCPAGASPFRPSG